MRCSTVGYFWKRTTSSGIPTLARLSKRLLAKARRRPPQDSAHACRALAPTYAFRIFYHCPTTRSYAICGKTTQLSAGKSERQLCTPNLVPSKSRPLSHISDLLLGSLSSLLIERSRFFLLLSRAVRAWFLAMAFVSFKALDVLMVHSP